MGNDTDQSLEFCLARISFRPGLRRTGPCGAGVVLWPGHIITCAHVILAALGLPDQPIQKPVDPVPLDFPLISVKNSFQSEIAFFDVEMDLAGLKLTESLPQQLIPANLINEQMLWGKKIKACGFPKGFADGAWVEGELWGPIKCGWIEIHDPQTTGHIIEPGFSGAPAWSATLGGCLGIITAATNDEARRVAYMLPAHLIQEKLNTLSADALSPGSASWEYIDNIKLAFFRVMEKEIAMHKEKYSIQHPQSMAQVVSQNYLAILYMGQEIRDIQHIGSEIKSFALEIKNRSLSGSLENRLDAILETVVYHIDLDAGLLLTAREAEPENSLVKSADMSLHDVENAILQIDNARMYGDRKKIFTCVDKLGHLLFLLAGGFENLYDEMEEYLHA